jgi:nucleoside-diphosphate-sugar epimerase
MKKIAVIGGTGMLGQPVARRLLEAGYPIRVLSTQAGKVKRIFGEKVEEVLGGVEEPESLNKLIQGCWGVHLNLLGGPKKEDFFRIEAEGTRKVVAACKQHGVKKITMTSGMALYHVKPQEVVREDYPKLSRCGQVPGRATHHSKWLGLYHFSPHLLHRYLWEIHSRKYSLPHGQHGS